MCQTTAPIPVFFSSDDNYLPFLAVAIRSLIDNLSPTAYCNIYILNNGLNPEKLQILLDMATDRVSVEPVDVSVAIAPIAQKLHLRDYYTASIYFRLFIPSLFPQYSKALYIDADVTVLGDISELYSVPLGDRLLAAVSDDIIASCEDFQKYAEEGLGIPYRQYFNSGVLLMNLDGFRAERIEQKFVTLLNTYHFDTVCPDQDYLNVLCCGRVYYLDKSWNKMSIDEDYEGEPKLIHYNMFYKPWLYKNICYQAHFWKYAERVAFYEEIRGMRKKFGWRGRLAHKKAHRALHKNTKLIRASEKNFRRVLGSVTFNADEGWINA